MQVAVIIPALNEAGCIGDLVEEVKSLPVAQTVVVDNGSTDGTGQAAIWAGAQVVHESRQGYGYACAAGIAAARDSDVFVFLDGDYSFQPSEMPRLLAPLHEKRADLVLGSRARGSIAPGSMPFHQRFGNWLVATLVRRLYGLPITDLGPYRAVRRELMLALEMREMTYGWPTEMIIKAARQHARIIEVPISYHARRAGQSKVSGTVRGTLLAAQRILSVTFRYAFT